LRKVIYRVITNDVSGYINLLVRIADIICNYSLPMSEFESWNGQMDLHNFLTNRASKKDPHDSKSNFELMSLALLLRILEISGSILILLYEAVPKSFWTESKYMLTKINTH